MHKNHFMASPIFSLVLLPSRASCCSTRGRQSAGNLPVFTVACVKAHVPR